MAFNSDWKPIEDVVLDIFDRRGVTPTKLGGEFGDSGHRVISAKLMKGRRLDLRADEARFVDGDLFRKWMRSPLRAGDVLMTSEAPLGELAYIAEDIDWCLGQRLFALRPNPALVDGRFLYYALYTDEVRADIHGRASGTTVLGIRQAELRKVKIPVPSLDEQRRAALLLGAIDDRIDLLRQASATLEAIAQALFKSWFVDFDPVRAKAEGREPEGTDAETAALLPNEFEESELGLIPKGWRWQSLAGAFEINPKRVLSKGAIAPYLDMASVRTSGHVADLPIPRVFSSGSKFQKGDTLLARITPCLENGKTAYVDFLDTGQVGWGSTEFIVLRPKGAMPPFAGYLLARQEDFRTFAVQAMSGSSGRQRVELTQLSRFPVVVPPDAIAAAFGDLVEPLRASITANERRATTLADLRDTLLPRLISGKLRLPEAQAIVVGASV